MPVGRAGAFGNGIEKPFGLAETAVVEQNARLIIRRIRVAARRVMLLTASGGSRAAFLAGARLADLVVRLVYLFHFFVGEIGERIIRAVVIGVILAR